MITQLNNAVAAVCPIDGVSIGNVADKTTWRIDAKASATTAQITAAQNVINTFDVATVIAQDTADASSLVADAAEAKTDAAITALKALTPAQARAWVVANVNTLADAKTLLGTMAAVLCVLARRL